MQKWEYKTIIRDRTWEYDRKADVFVCAEWDIDIPKMLPQLGREGWELAIVSPRSNYLGGGHGVGGATSISYDYAGYTSSEIWVFKRPMD